MSDVVRLRDDERFKPKGLREVVGEVHTGFTQEAIQRGVSGYIRSLNRKHIRKELQSAFDLSPSAADKLVLGQLHISAPLLLNLDAYFGGEVLRSLRGLPEDKAKERILQHLQAIKELAL